VFFLCSVLCFKTTDSLISTNAKVCAYECNCIMISNTFNFFNTEKSPDSLADLVYLFPFYDLQDPSVP